MGPVFGLSATVICGAFVTLKVKTPETHPVVSLRIAKVTVDAEPFGVMLTLTNCPPLSSLVPVIVTVPPCALKIESCGLLLSKR